MDNGFFFRTLWILIKKSNGFFVADEVCNKTAHHQLLANFMMNWFEMRKNARHHVIVKVQIIQSTAFPLKTLSCSKKDLIRSRFVINCLWTRLLFCVYLSNSSRVQCRFLEFSNVFDELYACMDSRYWFHFNKSVSQLNHIGRIVVLTALHFEYCYKLHVKRTFLCWTKHIYICLNVF